MLVLTPQYDSWKSRYRHRFITRAGNVFFSVNRGPQHLFKKMLQSCTFGMDFLYRDMFFVGTELEHRAVIGGDLRGEVQESFRPDALPLGTAFIR